MGKSKPKNRALPLTGNPPSATCGYHGWVTRLTTQDGEAQLVSSGHPHAHRPPYGTTLREPEDSD